MKPLKVNVCFTLDEEVIKKLRIMAENADRPLSQYINRLLKEYIASTESIGQDDDHIKG